MNAIVGFCHFCESHGPQVVFCTEVFKENETKNSEDCTTSHTDCPACTSVGVDMKFKTKDKNGILFCSKQVPSTKNLQLLLKQACMRSLSCEVSTTKENALVFFGDATRGYVLSYSFQLKDTRARGLKRLFSLIILMRDKMYLLNLTTYFSNEMQVTAKELEALANEVYSKEQATCSQRAFRLRRGKMDSEPPRSLEKLTGKKNVFGYVHIRSSHMLSSASKIYTEVSCNDLLPTAPSAKSNLNENRPLMSLRQLENYLTSDIFLKVIYCTLIGLQVVVRGDSDNCSAIVSTLESLLPVNSSCSEYGDYVPPTISRLFSCKSSVAVPQPCSGVCRIDIVNEVPLIHWCADLPSKWPTLMSNIVKGIHEKGFNDSTLNLHVSSLKEEWKNNAMALKSVQHSSTVIISSIKQSLGLKAQDQSLLEYWMTNIVI